MNHESTGRIIRIYYQIIEAPFTLELIWELEHAIIGSLTLGFDKLSSKARSNHVESEMSRGSATNS